MTNVYYKIANQSISAEFKERIIAKVQDELKNSLAVHDENLYDTVSEIRIKKKKVDVDSVLKHYLFKQFVQNIQNYEAKSATVKYQNTANKNIYKNIADNKYYKLVNGEWELAENIVSVNDDGSYVVDERKNNYAYTCRKEYDTENKLLSMQVVSPDGYVISDKEQVIVLTGMKKEFAQRYKYSGYSGESKDLVATLLNSIVPPVETGFYMDKSYNLFQWNQRKKCFVSIKMDSPLLTDYEFDSSKKVIRKEYTGIK